MEVSFSDFLMFVFNVEVYLQLIKHIHFDPEISITDVWKKKKTQSGFLACTETFVVELFCIASKLKIKWMPIKTRIIE